MEKEGRKRGGRRGRGRGEKDKDCFFFFCRYARSMYFFSDNCLSFFCMFLPVFFVELAKIFVRCAQFDRENKNVRLLE